MERNMEEHIKQSFNDFELPFDPNAWDSMRVQLDKRMPVKSNNVSKWLFGSFLTLVGVGSLVYLNIQDNSIQTEHKTLVSKSTNKDQQPLSSGIEMGNNSSSIEEAPSSLSKNEPVYESPAETETKTAEQNLLLPIIRSVATVIENEIATSIVSSPTNDENPSDFTLPVVQIQRLQCKGTVQRIENNNKSAIRIESPLGESTWIAAGSTLTFQPDQQGIYKIISEKNTVMDQITVEDSKKPEFSYEGNIEYQNGLPTCTFRTTETAQNMQWSVNGKNVSSDNLGMHFYPFTKGTYFIQLHTTFPNGCSSNCSKEIQIDEEYNLMAVTAFEPNSPDIRKNRFMPFALTQRNTDFSMIIINPSDGAIVFQTTDATNGWDGTDRQSGKQVEPNKAYIWKVSLKNPIPGEKGEYKGTIVKL